MGIWVGSVVVIVGVQAYRTAHYLARVDAALRKHRYKCNSRWVGQASEVPQLNGVDLERLTGELCALGFLPLGDIISEQRVQSATPSSNPFTSPLPDVPSPNGKTNVLGAPIAQVELRGLGRLFSHPSYGCNATLISVVSWHLGALGTPTGKYKAAPFRTSIASISGHGPDKWTYSTGNREYNPITHLFRRPRGLSTRMVGANAAQMLAGHLQKREEISRRAGISWNPAATMSEYLAHEDDVGEHIRAFHQRQNAVGYAIKLWLNKRRPSNEWMGELPRR